MLFHTIPANTSTKGTAMINMGFINLLLEPAFDSRWILEEEVRTREIRYRTGAGVHVTDGYLARSATSCATLQLHSYSNLVE